MGLITISEMFDILRRYFIRISAFAVAVAVMALVVLQNAQTYTCTLNYKYNYEEAALGYAPDGESPIDPYQIQDPLVISAALERMGLSEEMEKAINVEKVRNNIAIQEVIEEIDQEVSDSAALMGEKYTVEPTEFKIKYTYDASYGTEFGTKFFDRLITAYDDYLLKQYYNKREIIDFAKIIDPEDEDYLDMATLMEENLVEIITYLEDEAGYHPKFRSKRTGYSFHDLATLYHNLYDIQYAKYYGNVRAGNLSRDPEMVIKNYQAQVDDLTLEHKIAAEIAEGYFDEVVHFYDSYKKTALYDQAQDAQSNVVHSNNRDTEVLRDYEIDNHLNTYDNIVLRYTDSAEKASRLQRDIEHCNEIIKAYTEDTVNAATKERLLDKNAAVFAEIKTLSTRYSELANATLNEFFDGLVNEDLRYLIVTDVQSDLPITLYVIFAFILSFGMAYILILIRSILSRNDAVLPGSDEELKQTGRMTELQSMFCEQVKHNFDEMYLLYQPMFECRSGKIAGYEAYIRWNSREHGMIPPNELIAVADELNLLPQLNSWIIEQICLNLATRRRNHEPLPIIHINCPYFALDDFGLADIIVKYAAQYNVDVRNICMEIDGPHVTACLDDVLLLQKIGAKICIDRFERSHEQEEIIRAVRPDCIKFSANVIDVDVLDTASAEERTVATAFIRELLDKCNENGIKTCVCGIETPMQEKLLVNAMRFTYRQGYLYGRPDLYDSNKTSG